MASSSEAELEFRSAMSVEEALGALAEAAEPPWPLGRRERIVGFRLGSRCVFWCDKPGFIDMLVPRPALWCRVVAQAQAPGASVIGRLGTPPDPLLLLQIAFFGLIVPPFFGAAGLLAWLAVSGFLIFTAGRVARQFLHEDREVLERWVAGVLHPPAS